MTEEQTTRLYCKKGKKSQLTAVFLVAVVTAVVPVIAPVTLLDAALRGVTPELVQSAGRLHIVVASLLVPAVPAVQITVALLLFGYTELRGGSDASEVVRLALSIRYNTHTEFLSFLRLSSNRKMPPLLCNSMKFV